MPPLELECLHYKCSMSSIVCSTPRLVERVTVLRVVVGVERRFLCLTLASPGHSFHKPTMTFDRI